MTAVQKLREDQPAGTEPASSPAAALGLQLQVSASDGRVAMLQTHIANDQDLSAIKGLLGKMADAADWLKARYDLEAARKERDVHKKTFAQMVEDEERCRLAWERDHAIRVRDIEKLAGEYDTAFDEAYGQHTASGRRADRAKFQPPPAVRQRATALAQLRDEAEKKQLEHDAEVKNHETNVKRWREILEQDDAEIARLEALAAG